MLVLIEGELDRALFVALFRPLSRRGVLLLRSPALVSSFPVRKLLQLLLDVLSDLLFQLLCLRGRWFLSLGIGVQVLLEEVAIQLTQAFTEQHVCNGPALLVHDLFNPLANVVLVAQRF